MSGSHWQGYHLKQIAIIRGNVFVLNGIALLIFGAAYALVYKLLWNVQQPESLTQWTFFGVVAGALALIVLHELLHVVTAWVMTDRAKVGVRMRLMVIECHVDSRLSRSRYIAYAAAPTLVLGLAGIVLYYSFSSVEAKFFSSLLFLGGLAGGGGDFWFVAQVLRYDRDCSILDKGTEIDIFRNEPGEPPGATPLTQS